MQRQRMSDKCGQSVDIDVIVTRDLRIFSHSTHVTPITPECPRTSPNRHRTSKNQRPRKNTVPVLPRPLNSRFHFAFGNVLSEIGCEFLAGRSALIKGAFVCGRTGAVSGCEWALLQYVSPQGQSAVPSISFFLFCCQNCPRRMLFSPIQPNQRNLFKEDV